MIKCASSAAQRFAWNKSTTKDLQRFIDLNLDFAIIAILEMAKKSLILHAELFSQIGPKIGGFDHVKSYCRGFHSQLPMRMRR